jgi:hypothetical protein
MGTLPVCQAITVDSGPACWSWLAQCHGDVVGDNALVQLEDFFAFKDAYGGIYPAAKYNACADFDRNGAVELADFFVFKDAFAITSVPSDCTPGGTWPPTP